MKADLKEIAFSILSFIALALFSTLVKTYKEQVLANRQSYELNKKEYTKEIALRLFKESKLILDELILTIVLATEQTKAKDIRKKIKDGTLDKSFLFSLADEVLVNVKAQLNINTRDILRSGISDLDAYIRAKIEENVGAIKYSTKEINALNNALEVTTKAYIDKGLESNSKKEEYLADVLEDKALAAKKEV